MVLPINKSIEKFYEIVYRNIFILDSSEFVPRAFHTGDIWSSIRQSYRHLISFNTHNSKNSSECAYAKELNNHALYILWLNNIISFWLYKFTICVILGWKCTFWRNGWSFLRVAHFSFIFLANLTMLHNNFIWIGIVGCSWRHHRANTWKQV